MPKFRDQLVEKDKKARKKEEAKLVDEIKKYLKNNNYFSCIFHKERSNYLDRYKYVLRLFVSP